MNKSDWKFIPYSLYNNKEIYYRLKKIMSFNLPWMGIIGARGRGKTFAVKEHLINDFLLKNRRFVWCRDSAADCEKLAEDNGLKFLEDIGLMNCPGLDEIKVKGWSIYVNGKNAGEMMPASLYQSYKGDSYQSVYNVNYDEFIPESIVRHKVGVRAKVNTMSTVFRLREEGRVFMTSNALDRGDEFLQFLGVDLFDFGFYVNRKMGFVLHYADNSAEFDLKNSKGLVGKLLLNANSNLSDSIMCAKFEQKQDLIFEKLPPKSTLFVILESFTTKARLYKCKDCIYVTPDVDRTTYMNRRYVVNIEEAEPYKPLLSGEIKKKLKLLLVNNKFRFQTTFLQKFITEILK